MKWLLQKQNNQRHFSYPFLILCKSMEFSRPDTGVDSLSLLQGIFPTQGSNPGLPRCRWILSWQPPGKPPWVLIDAFLWCWLAFSWWLMILSILHALVYLLGRSVCSDPLPIVKPGYLRFYYWVETVLDIVYILDSYQIRDWQIIDSILWVVFSVSW